jgi:hypothetical protein
MRHQNNGLRYPSRTYSVLATGLVRLACPSATNCSNLLQVILFVHHAIVRA